VPLQGAAPVQASAYTEFEDGSQIDLTQAKVDESRRFAGVKTVWSA